MNLLFAPEGGWMDLDFAILRLCGGAHAPPQQLLRQQQEREILPKVIH
jgi:hypothetical protein